MQRLDGVRIGIDALAEMAARFAEVRWPVLYQIDGRTVTEIDDLIECVVEDMLVDHVAMAVVDDHGASLRFAFSQDAVEVLTDSRHESYRNAFHACARILVAQPLTQSGWCEIAVGPASGPTAGASTDRVAGPSLLVATVTRWLRSSAPWIPATPATSVAPGRGRDVHHPPTRRSE